MRLREVEALIPVPPGEADVCWAGERGRGGMGAATASLTFSLRTEGSEDRLGRWLPDLLCLKLSPSWS